MDGVNDFKKMYLIEFWKSSGVRGLGAPADERPGGKETENGARREDQEEHSGRQAAGKL